MYLTEKIASPFLVKKKLLPLPYGMQEKVKNFRERAKKICLREEESLALVIGPCSIHHFQASLEYASLLSELISKIEGNFFVLMRVFTQKARSCLGWKGLCYDPLLDSSENLEEGILLSRKLMIEISKKNIPIATELLDPFLFPFFDDLITWGFIGARTALSPIHRSLASIAPFPVGFKNPLDGSLEGSIAGIRVAKTAQKTLSICEDGFIVAKKSSGNPYSHLVLRGSSKGPNFHADSLEKAKDLLKKENLAPSYFIDCSHGNAVEGQERAFFSSINHLLQGEKNLIGIMLESYLKAGKQTFSSSVDPYLSITDECLSWEETEELLLQASSLLVTSHSL